MDFGPKFFSHRIILHFRKEIMNVAALRVLKYYHIFKNPLLSSASVVIASDIHTTAILFTWGD